MWIFDMAWFNPNAQHDHHIHYVHCLIFGMFEKFNSRTIVVISEFISGLKNVVTRTNY